MTKQFLNDVVKPWETLNALLAQNFAIHNEVSDLARDAKQLAIAIKHQAEALGASVSEMTAESRVYSVMSDVADAAKHGNLRDAGRNNKLVLSALHEFKEPQQFRFIRNAISIQHATHGELDFMEVALEAANYCIAKFGLNAQWVGKVKECC